MRGKNILICIDRDGTLVYDKKYYLGSQRDWKKKVRFMPGVVSGLKRLRKIPNAKIHIITNQPGVAVKNFPLLTKKKAKEVCSHILKMLEKKGVKLDGCEICEHASPKYVKEHPHFKFNKKLVGNFQCMKPNPGMIKNALKKSKWNKRNTDIYLIGDRVSDMKSVMKLNGTGILVPFSNRPGEKENLKKIKYKKKHIAKNFSAAAKIISS